MTTSIYAVRDALLLAGISCHLVWQNYASHNSGVPEGINFWANNPQKFPAATLWRPGAGLRYGISSYWVMDMYTAEPDTAPAVLVEQITEWLEMEAARHG